MKRPWIKVLGILVILLVNGRVDSQCSPESELYLMQSDICYGDNTVFNENDVDNGPESGITCFRRGSTSTEYTLTNFNGDNVACDAGVVQCVPGNGFLIVYTQGNFNSGRSGMYTCCIDGKCISTRIYVEDDYNDLFDSVIPTIDECSITPPVDVTVAPQQYIVNMITSQVPPRRLEPEITFTTSENCTNQDGISCDAPYYLHLGDEMYKYSLPVNWDATNSEFTHHQFECGAMFETTQLTASMTSIRAPDDVPTVNYEDINATAIRIFWNISTSFVNGYIITITSSNLPNITYQVNDETVKEFVVNELLRETDYNIEVRGYYDLLGAPGSVTARLESTIIGINGTLLSVTSNTQEVQLNCFTSRVKPSEITWIFQAPRTQLEGSELLDETSMTYRHYIQVNGTFIAGINVSCSNTVNGQTDTVDYSLEAPSGPPTDLSVKILSSSSLSINWVPPLGVVEGYIIQYSGIDPQLINGGDTLSDILEDLTQGVIYQFNVFAYSDLPSTESNKVTVLLDTPQISFLTADPINTTSITINWNTTVVSIVDNYTLTYTRICDGMETSVDIEDSMQTSIDIHNLTSGLEYTLSIQPENILGKGTEMFVSTLLNETRPPETPQLSPPVLLNSTSIRVEWNEVECTQRIARYVIQYNISDGSSSNEVIANAETTSIVITGLSRYSLYSISIAAMNSIGSSLFSEIFTFFTFDSELTDLSAVVFTTSVQLSWEAIISNNDITYTYEAAFVVSTDTECSSTNVNTLPDGYTSYLNTSDTEIEIIELEADTCYIFGVRIYSSYSTVPGDWNILVEGTEVDRVLTDLSAVVFTTSVQLSWEAIISNNDITYTYEVAFIVSTDTECSSTNVNTLPDGYTSYRNTSDTEIEIIELEADTCYIFGVRIYSSYSTVPGDWNILVERTEEITQRQATSDGIGPGGIAGIVITLIVIIAIIIVVVVVVLVIFRRSGKHLQYSTEREMNTRVYVKQYRKDEAAVVLNTSEVAPKEEATYSTVNEEQDVYENVTKKDAVDYTNPNPVYSSEYEDLSKISHFDPKIPTTLPMSIENMGDHVAECHQQNNQGFKTQFEQIYDGSDKSTDTGFRKENRKLNRFKNITVYDDNLITMMPIQGRTNMHTDFINACYIDGYSMPKKYIATQGPLPTTVDDFWWLMWQEKVQYIVMLTNLMEGKNKKCSQYWPDTSPGSMTYGPFTVTVKEEQSLSHFVVRNLTVKLEGSSDILAIKHIQFITWPDHGVPDSVSPFMTLSRRVTNWWYEQKAPIVVHCSAGVGRTGSFIAIDIALEQANKEGIVDIPGIVNRLRQQRMCMVQTDAQFAFIHDAVLEAVVGGTTEITSDLFRVKVDNWRQKNPNTGKTQMQVQYQLLSQVTPNQDDVLKQTAESFPEKNRSMKYIPNEKWRVSLKGEYPNYIHATFIHGYRTKKAFIIAQSPMENTTRDFLKMIVDYKVSVVVMCCDLQERGKETCFMYWNPQSKLCFAEFEIEMKNMIREEGFIQREFVIKNTKNNTYHTVIQFQIENWSYDGSIHHPHTILNVIENVIKVQQRTGGGQVVVHCSNTVSRSAVYCVVSNAIEQCKTEGVVDVFQATKAVRIHKPGAVITLNQYNTIHEVILAYFEMHSIYSNFQFHN